MKNKILKRLLENFKDPYNVIKVWQQITILGFLVGIVVGATFTQNYYINQVNKVFEDAAEKNGCFNNYLNNHLVNNNISGLMEDFSPLSIYNVSNETHKPD